MTKLKCKKCGSENIRVYRKVQVCLPWGVHHSITKTTMRRGDVHLGWADDDMEVFCGDCGYILSPGRVTRRLMEMQAERTEAQP